MKTTLTEPFDYVAWAAEQGMEILSVHIPIPRESLATPERRLAMERAAGDAASRAVWELICTPEWKPLA